MVCSKLVSPTQSTKKIMKMKTSHSKSEFIVNLNHLGPMAHDDPPSVDNRKELSRKFCLAKRSKTVTTPADLVRYWCYML